MNTVALKEGERIAAKSILHLILLGCLKLAAGLFTGMAVVIADAISTFADTLGLFASYIGLKLSRKSADEKFEYGYYKVETFAAFLISIGLLYLGYKIFKDSILNFNIVKEGTNRSFAITSTVIAIIFSYKLEKELSAVGKRVNSLSLIAAAEDKKIDVFSGVIVLGSIVANYMQIPYIEDVVTMLFAVLILKVGISSAKESLFFLLDYWNDPILTRKIRAVFRKEQDIIKTVKKIRLRRAGTFVFGEAFIEVNPFAGLQDLREELNLLEEKIKALNPYFKEFSIHSHISKSQSVKVAVPIRGGRSLSSEVAHTLKETNAYLFARIRKGKIKDFYVKKLKKGDKEVLSLANYLKAERVNILIDNELNSIIYFNLRRTHHILIYPNFADTRKAKDTLELLLIDT